MMAHIDAQETETKKGNKKNAGWKAK
jgi:hypothetical protein